MVWSKRSHWHSVRSSNSVWSCWGLEPTKHSKDYSYIACCRNLKREYSEPSNAVFPSAGKSPRRVNKPANVHGKCSINRVHNGQFGERLHHQVSKHNRQNTFTTDYEFVNPYIMPPIVNPLDLSIRVGFSGTYQWSWNRWSRHQDLQFEKPRHFRRRDLRR